MAIGRGSIIIYPRSGRGVGTLPYFAPNVGSSTSFQRHNPDDDGDSKLENPKRIAALLVASWLAIRLQFLKQISF